MNLSGDYLFKAETSAAPEEKTAAQWMSQKQRYDLAKMLERHLEVAEEYLSQEDGPSAPFAPLTDEEYQSVMGAVIFAFSLRNKEENTNGIT